MKWLRLDFCLLGIRSVKSSRPGALELLIGEVSADKRGRGGPAGRRYRSRRQRSSASRPADASTVGLTGTSTPDSTQARWLGAKRGARRPSLISRVTAKRLNTVGGRNKRSLFGKP